VCIALDAFPPMVMDGQHRVLDACSDQAAWVGERGRHECTTPALLTWAVTRQRTPWRRHGVGREPTSIEASMGSLQGDEAAGDRSTRAYISSPTERETAMSCRMYKQSQYRFDLHWVSEVPQGALSVSGNRIQLLAEIYHEVERFKELSRLPSRQFASECARAK
jgi:hypothetical protein